MPDAKTKSAPIRWKDICRSLYMVGLMKDFSKGECWRVRTMLVSKINDGTVQQISRGLYQIKPEIVAQLLAQMHDNDDDDAAAA